MQKKDKIFVAGHLGLVGSAITRALKKEGHTNLVLRTHRELDLEVQAEVQAFFENEKPDYVFLAAAKVGGILANNTYRAEFIYNNLIIQSNVIDSCWRFGAKRLVFLGSSCIYPRNCPQPINEEHLLTGILEPTNEPYAIAKISGLKMCEAYNHQYNTDFITVMPTNLYGPNDNFHLESAHVLPALMRKMHEAKVSGKKEMVVWGSGKPKREFLHVDDLASACLFCMNRAGYTDIVNIGSGEEVTIGELANLIREVVEFEGKLVFDRSKPDGTPRKFLDSSRIQKLGWSKKIGLREGLANTYQWFLENQDYFFRKPPVKFVKKLPTPLKGKDLFDKVKKS